MTGGIISVARGNILEALPQLIPDFRRGYLSQAKIANKNGVDPRTLRAALRKGEENGYGPLHDLYLAEFSSRDKRPWGRRSGAGRPFPKPSARSLAGRVGEERWWELETNSADDGNEGGDGESGESGNGYPRERDAGFYDLLGLDQGYQEDLRSSTVSSAVKRPDDKSSTRGPGRPGILTLQLVEDIALSVGFGGSITEIAAGFGIHRRRLLKWLARGKSERDSIYGGLFLRVTTARATRSGPARLTKILEAIIGVRPDEPLELNLATLRGLCACTAVVYRKFAPVEGRQHLIELRWPKAGRKLGVVPEQFVKEGLQVSARDREGGYRSIVFLAGPPPLRAKSPKPTAKAARKTQSPQSQADNRDELLRSDTL